MSKLKSDINARIITIGEKWRANVQFDIPFTTDRFRMLSLAFEKEQQNIHILCHNLYKKIHNV